MEEQRPAFMNKYTHKIAGALRLLFNVRWALGCLLLLWAGMLASCVSTSAYLDDLSLTCRVYVESGEIYESGGKEYEKLWVGDYERHAPLICAKECHYYTYYTELSPEKMVYFKEKDTENDPPTLFTEDEITGIRFLRKEEKKNKEPLRLDRVTEYGSTTIEERRSLAGKILKPLIYVDAIAVDVPLSVCFMGGAVVLAIPLNIIKVFSPKEEKKSSASFAGDTEPQDTGESQSVN